MKLTLLEMVQLILSSMDSDEVNSITDTVESMQVANIVKESYLDLVSRINLPEMYTLFELEASTDPDKPTLMTLPSDIDSLLWLKYDKRDNTETIPKYERIVPMDIEEFLDHIYRYDREATEFVSFTHDLNGDSIDFFCYNNLHPRYYTVLEDRTIIFDSYDSTVDTTLQNNKTVAYGVRVPVFELSDTFTPDLDSAQFNLLLNEAKRQAFVDLKQAQNIVAEQRARRGWVKSQKSKEAVPTSTLFTRRTDYGRK